MLRAAVAARFPAWLAAKGPRAVTTPARVAVVTADARSQLLKAVPERRACFCSKAAASSGSGRRLPLRRGPRRRVVRRARGEKASSAIMSMPGPEDCHTVIALPLLHRPLFPGFYMPISVKDPKLLQALIENQKRSIPYAGAFLVKNDESTEPNNVSSSESEKNIHDLKGKELLKRLHDVGTLAQITSIRGNLVVLLGHRRLRITEMVAEDPLTVKVDHLKENYERMAEKNAKLGGGDG